MKKIDLLPPSENNQRNTEGSMLELKNGRILFIYSHFYGGDNDASSAYLAARYSSDRGESWTQKDEIIIRDEGRENVMSVSLLRLKSGKIVLCYAVKNSATDCKYYIRKSGDEGKTWGERICVTNQNIDGSEYFVVNNDRLVQMASGRLIVPACHHTNTVNSFGPGNVMLFYSDDEGKTWMRSNIIHPPDTKDTNGLQEPGVVEIENGKILIWMRTAYGYQYYSSSEDGGETLKEPVPSPLVSPLSPASIKMIPGSDNLLAVYNDHEGRDYRWKRTPLVTRISRDRGKTWINPFVIEDDPEGRFCYTSILFVDNKIILSYSAPESGKVWGRMRVTLLERGEVYGE